MNVKLCALIMFAMMPASIFASNNFDKQRKILLEKRNASARALLLASIRMTRISFGFEFSGPFSSDVDRFRVLKSWSRLDKKIDQNKVKVVSYQAALKNLESVDDVLPCRRQRW